MAKYPSINDREFDLLKKITENTADISTDEAGDVASITGTANQVIVDQPTGAVTLSLPQSIATSSTPTFAGLNLSANLVFSDTGEGVAFHGGGTITGASGTLDLTPLAGQAINLNTTSGGVRLPSTATAGLQLYNTVDQVTNYERLNINWATNEAEIRTNAGGSGTARVLTLSANGISTMRLRPAGSTSGEFQFVGTASSLTNGVGYNFSGYGSNGSSGTGVGLLLSLTHNQSSVAAATDFQILRTETAVGSGTQNLIQAGTAASPSLFTVTNTGRMSLGAGTTTSTQRTFGARFDANDPRYMEFSNANGGGSPTAELRLSQTEGTVTTALRSGITGPGFSPAGVLLADGAFSLSGSALAGGYTIGTQAAAPLIFATNDAEVGRFLSLGTLQLTAGTTARAPFNLPHGSAPTAPVNGDMWTTSAGLYVQINGVTVGPLS